MRRGIGFTLICVGLFLAVLGGAIRYWAYDRLVVVPVDLYSTIDLPGKATYLDLTTLTEKTGNVVARQTIRADVDASTDRVLVVDLSQVISTADGRFLRASVERAAIDRRTGTAVNCCDESVDEKPTRHEGYLFKLPFDAPRGDVMLWDGTSASANPGTFEGTDTIAGQRVYRYVSEVPGRQIRTQTDSGALVGEDRTYDAPVWNSSTRTLWVEPVTGTPLAVALTTRTTLRNSRGQDKATVFAATLRSDPAKPNPETLALVAESKRRIELVQQVPLSGLGSGATLAVFGVALLLWRRRPVVAPAPISPAPPSYPRTWEVEDLGPGRPVSPAPIADRPLSRYIRPYLDGDTGGHRRPEPDPLDPATDWLTLIGPHSDHTVAPPEPREPPPVPPRRVRRPKRYPDGW